MWPRGHPSRTALSRLLKSPEPTVCLTSLGRLFHAWTERTGTVFRDASSLHRRVFSIESSVRWCPSCALRDIGTVFDERFQVARSVLLVDEPMYKNTVSLLDQCIKRHPVQLLEFMCSELMWMWRRTRNPSQNICMLWAYVRQFKLNPNNWRYL